MMADGMPITEAVERAIANSEDLDVIIEFDDRHKAELYRAWIGRTSPTPQTTRCRYGWIEPARDARGELFCGGDTTDADAASALRAIANELECDVDYLLGNALYELWAAACKRDLKVSLTLFPPEEMHNGEVAPSYAYCDVCGFDNAFSIAGAASEDLDEAVLDCLAQLTAERGPVRTILPDELSCPVCGGKLEQGDTGSDWYCHECDAAWDVTPMTFTPSNAIPGGGDDVRQADAD